MTDRDHFGRRLPPHDAHGYQMQVTASGSRALSLSEGAVASKLVQVLGQQAAQSEVDRLEARVHDLKHPAVPPIPAVTPRRLPAVRDRALQAWADHGRAATSGSGQGVTFGSEYLTPEQAGLRLHKAVDGALRSSELFWVAGSMSALVDGACDTLPDDTVPGKALAPAECGFLVFEAEFALDDEGTELSDAAAVVVPVRALSWGPGGNGLTVVLWADVRSVAEAYARREVAVSRQTFGSRDARALRDAQLRAQTDWALSIIVPKVGALYPFGVSSFSWDRPLAEAREAVGGVLARLLTTWLLMSQPLLSNRTRLPADPNVARKYRKASRPDPEVTIIDLRHIKTPHAGEPSPDGPTRTYTRRWVVRGHWRNQAYGPGRSQRRPVFIPSYIKGPDGLPLRMTEHVNVWRR